MLRHRVRLVMFMVLLCGVAAVTSASDEGLTLEGIFGEKPLFPAPAPGLTWRPQVGTLLYLEEEGDGSTRRNVLVEVDVRARSRRTLFDALALAGDDGEVPSLEDLVFGPAGSNAFLAREGSLQVIRLDDGHVGSIDLDGRPTCVVPSPLAGRVAFVMNNDLYVADISGKGRALRVTSDGSETVLNGRFDWVYTEELTHRDPAAIVWSADGAAVAWLRTDDTGIPLFHLVDVLGVHSDIRRQRYPKAGDPAPEVSLHIAYIDEALEVRSRVEINPPVGDGYLPRFGWWPTGTMVWCQILDHDQDVLRLVRFDLVSGANRQLVEERDPFWVEPVDMFHLLPDGRFVWASRSSGFMHLELRDAEGERIRDLTPGQFDVTRLVGVDAENGVLFWIAARPHPRQRRMLRTALDGEGVLELTPSDGTHTGELSPSGKLLFIRRSAVDQPPTLELVRSGGEILDLDGLLPSGGDSEVSDRPALPRPRWVTVRADDGTRLNAMVIRPLEREPKAQYPAVVYVYGGPHAQVVRDRWSRTLLFHRWLAGRDFVVFALDNRGSAGRGRDFEGAVNHSLGQLELSDQLAGARWLREQPFVDGERIGIWGWSYGGYMACRALTQEPGVFRAGVAVAPVTDWRLYDSIYTERYMGTPEANAEGYDAGSVLESADALTDRLMVMHGTGDDNVHVQHTLQLADRAWRSGASFDLTLYPNLKHGLRAPGSRCYVFSRMVEHLERWLARDRDGSDG